jgi:16S rRNA (adenine1518-N6/adenine1519-N6)-dimethyltransferase
VGERLGQHFLHRTSLLRRIAAAACPRQGDQVIEIGPGRGALTEHLLEGARRVIAIEVDRRLADHLRERFQGDGRLTVVEADVLSTDLSQWGPVSVAGNLPYYITSPVLEKVLNLGSLLKLGVFLVQKEVADRLTADPGSRHYGYLTVRTKLLARPEALFRVPPSAFRPPPKVDSAVVRLTPCPAGDLPNVEEFLGFVGDCFRHKRKTLRNNLAGIYGKGVLEAVPEASRRAEELSVEQFKDLYGRLKGREGKGDGS